MMASVALLILAGAASAAPVRISSETVKQPYDLIRGTIAATPELASIPWRNENLDFALKWGFFDVGWATMKAQIMEEFNGEPAVRIVSEAKSSKFCDAFYVVRDLNQSWIHASKFHSLGYSKKLREGGFFRDEWVVYDYPRKIFLSKRTNKNGESSYEEGPLDGYVQDILSSMYFLRTKKLEVGSEIILDVNTRKNWPLVVKVLRKTTIEVPAGEFETVVVEPFLRQEGIFVQKGKRMQVWLTNDARKLPVYLSVEIIFGHVTASLLRIN